MTCAPARHHRYIPSHPAPTLVGMAVACLLFLGTVASPVQAASRARLSRDLAERLASGGNGIARVIVHGDRARIARIAARYNLTVTRALTGAAVFEVTDGQLAALSTDEEIDHLSSDARVRSDMAVTNEAIGADQVWRGADGLAGLTGRGIGIAVIDSGVSPHKALKGRVIESLDLVNGGAAAHDRYGHGTHVAGIIAGSGDGTHVTFSGVAPGAHLINVRVLDETGAGYSSDVIDAIDWVIANKDRLNIRIVNLSLGHPVMESYRDDPTCEAVMRAVAAGLVVVTSAGNAGKTADGRPLLGGINSPGNTPSAITVGALNTRGTARRSDDVMATFSSWGPTYLDGLLKPDVAAPGNKIVSLEATGSTLALGYPERHVSGNGSSGLFQLSGTSMSAAVVSGAVALLLEASPALTPAQVKFALQLTSSFLPSAGLIGGGAGSINVAAAVGVVVTKPQVTEFSMIIGGEQVSTIRPSLATPVQHGSSFWGDQSIWSDKSIWSDGSIWSDKSIWSDGSIWSDKSIWSDGSIWSDTSIWSDGSIWSDKSIWSDGSIWSDKSIWSDGSIWSDMAMYADQ